MLKKNEYDDKKLGYLYAVIDKKELKLKPFAHAKNISFDKAPSLYFEKTFPVSGRALLEYITNYSFRHLWVKGVEKFEYNENEVTRLGTEHVCVIDGKHLNFVTVTKKGKPGQLVYGEMTTSPPPVDELYQFYIITPMSQGACKLEVEIYWKAKSIFKKIMLALLVKNILKKNIQNAINDLFLFVDKNNIT